MSRISSVILYRAPKTHISKIRIGISHKNPPYTNKNTIRWGYPYEMLMLMAFGGP